MRETAGLLEPPDLAKPRHPLPIAPPTRKWSARAFAKAWAAAKARNPQLRTKHLATPCDVDPATIRNWRKGVGQPDVDQSWALAAVLGCDPKDFTEPA